MGKIWNDKQREALNLILGDPSLVKYVEQVAKAKEDSDRLDDMGIQRKSADGAQTLHGPDGLLNQPGAENGKAMDEDEGKTEKCPKCGKPMKDGKCASCGYEKKSVEPEAAPAFFQAKGAGLQPNDVKTALGGDRPLMLSDLKDLYKAIAGQIEEALVVAQKAVEDKVVGEINKALEPRDRALIAIDDTLSKLEIVKDATLKEAFHEQVVDTINSQTKALAEVYQATADLQELQKKFDAEYGTPRILEQWKQLRASESGVTEVAKDSQFGQAKPTEYHNGTGGSLLEQIFGGSNGRAAR